MKSLEIVSHQQRVMTVIREPGQLGSFAAHIALAAKRASRRVLMVDLTRDGLMTRAILPQGNVPGGLSASHMFGVSIGGHAVEMISPGFFLVRSDAQLIDSALTVRDAASRLRKALAVLSHCFDLCIIEANEHVSVESLAAMKISSDVVTTACSEISSARKMSAHIANVSDLTSAAAFEEPKRPMMTVMPLAHALTRELDNTDDAIHADRILWAIRCEESPARTAHAA